MGLGKFKFAMSRFITIPTTCYFSFLSISTSIRFDGRVRAGSSSSQPGQLGGETGIVNVYRFCTFGQLH